MVVGIVLYDYFLFLGGGSREDSKVDDEGKGRGDDQEYQRQRRWKLSQMTGLYDGDGGDFREVMMLVVPAVSMDGVCLFGALTKRRLSVVEYPASSERIPGRVDYDVGRAHDENHPVDVGCEPVLVNSPQRDASDR